MTCSIINKNEINTLKSTCYTKNQIEKENEIIGKILIIIKTKANIDK